jgi:hypothetical protein
MTRYSMHRLFVSAALALTATTSLALPVETQDPSALCGGDKDKSDKKKKDEKSGDSATALCGGDNKSDKKKKDDGKSGSTFL